MAVNFGAIDPKYVDAEFPAFNEYTFGDMGVDRDRLNTFATYEDSVPVLSLRECREIAAEIQAAGGGLTRLVKYINDQGREGSCVGNATAKAMECLYAKQYGLDRMRPISAISIYKQIGRSPGSGAMISDALDAVTEVGAMPLDTPENRAIYGDQVMPARGFYTDYPNQWRTTAGGIVVLEHNIIRSVEGLCTASVNQDPVVVGRQGHSIMYADLLFKSADPSMVYANSWRESWGFGAGNLPGGFGLDTLSNLRRSAGWAFAIRFVKPYATAV